MTRKKWVTIGVVVLLLAGGGYLWYSSQDQGLKKKIISKIKEEVKPVQELVEEANVEIFSCPEVKICPKVTIPQCKKQKPRVVYREKIKVVYREKVDNGPIGCFPNWKKGIVKAKSRKGLNLRCLTDWRRKKVHAQFWRTGERDPMAKPQEAIERRLP